MNDTHPFPIIGLFILSLILPASSQTFSSGSDGSYGAINITSDTTLTTPVDGIFNATTIFVASNAVLTFTRNQLNTPVYLLASGSVVIEGGIDVSGDDAIGSMGGLGGPGGFAGGHGGGIGAGAGMGPGGGNPSKPGAYAEISDGTFGPLNSRLYGNTLLMPLIGGSGGGGRTGDSGGGGGGGAILISSSTFVQIEGGIFSLSGVASSSSLAGQSLTCGSGGAVRIVTPKILGSGIIDLKRALPGYDERVSAGRIRIDTLDPAPLITIRGVGSIGTFMQVFPTIRPKLEIIEVAGQPVSPTSATLLTIPIGGPLATTIKIRATDFQGSVPIQIALTPDSSNRTLVDHTINMGGATTVTETVNLTLSDNTLTHVHVWTRP